MSAIRPVSDLPFRVASSKLDMIQAPEPGPSIMRYELTDYEWTAIRPFLPNKPRGVPRVDDRRVLNGISGYCGRERHGAICRRPSGLTRPVTTGLFVGGWLAS